MKVFSAFLETSRQAFMIIPMKNGLMTIEVKIIRIITYNYLYI